MEFSQIDKDVPDYKGLKGDERWDRMRDRLNKKQYMLYPEDKAKINWDLLIAFVLVLTC